MKRFYRVANTDSGQGLWYDQTGEFTGLIHNEFNFCKNHDLPMPFDSNVVNYLSATDSLEELWLWFTEEDIKQLEKHGFFITVYQSSDYKLYKNHWLIHRHNTLVNCGILEIDKIR